jgi:hypothetical protein
MHPADGIAIPSVPVSVCRHNTEPCRGSNTSPLSTRCSDQVQGQGPRSPSFLPASPLSLTTFFSSCYSSSHFHITTIMASTLGLLSKHRAAVGVAAISSTAFALFGYDTTIAGGVIALKRYVLTTWQIRLANSFAAFRSSLSSQRMRSNL